MKDINIAFSQKLLKQVHDLVREHFPQMKMIHTIGWTYKSGNQWEWHNKEFTWIGKADNAYEARYHGWMAWLKYKGIEV